MGVVSWGNKCATEHYPGVNVGVSHFVDWMEDIMEENTPVNNNSTRNWASVSYFLWMLFLMHRIIQDF